LEIVSVEGDGFPYRVEKTPPVCTHSSVPEMIHHEASCCGKAHEKQSIRNLFRSLVLIKPAWQFML
jgi:hypothetical protein